MGRIIGLFVAAVIAVAGFFAFQEYEKSKFVASLAPHVKNTSLRLMNSTRHEVESDTKITFKELFDRLDGDISEVEKHLLDVQTLSSPKTTVITEPTLAYLKASQEVLRTMLSKYRKSMKLSLASDRSTEALAELRTSSGYGVEYASRSMDKALEALKAAEAEHKTAAPEFVASVEKLSETRTRVQKIFPIDALVSEERLKMLMDRNGGKSAAAAAPK